MHELILVMLLLINDADGRLQTYGPVTDGRDGPVMTWSSHTECSSFGDKVMREDTMRIDGFVCVVKPSTRPTI